MGRQIAAHACIGYKRFRLTLLTGGCHYRYYHLECGQITSLRKEYPYTMVQIHPQTADELGIEEKDLEGNANVFLDDMPENCNPILGSWRLKTTLCKIRLGSIPHEKQLKGEY